MRRHGIILLGRLMPPLIVLSVPVLIILYSALLYRSDPALAGALARTASFVLLILLVPLGLWGAFNTYDWANDSFHITNKRVIRFEQHFITSQVLIEAGLQQIQNIAVLIPDPLANTLNYGTVVIETAATSGRIEFDSIGDPRRVQRLLFELRGIPLPPQDPPAHFRFHSLSDVLLYLFPILPQYRPGGSVLYHKHWFVLVQAMALPLFMLGLVFSAIIVTRSVLPLILLIFVLPFLVYQYVNWINDVYILTERRIIDIVRVPLIREDRREALFEQIQNVTVTLPNFISRMLDMGEVFVETAGRAENFRFQSVHHPLDIKDELNKRLDAVRTGRRQAEEQNRRREVEELVMQVLRTHYGPPPSEEPSPTHDVEA